MDEAYLNNLKEIALRATPGPWKYDWGNHQIEYEKHRIEIVDEIQSIERKNDLLSRGYSKLEADKLINDSSNDMEFIEAFSPDVVLKLIEKIIDLESYLNKKGDK